MKKLEYQGSFWFRYFIEHKIIFLILGIIIFFYLINNFIWLRQNTYPSGPDEFMHLLRGLQFSKVISSNGKGFLHLFAEGTGHWPPLYYISSAILSLFLGTSYPALVMSNIAYLIILLFSVYFIGLKLFDRNTGLFSVILISMYPMIFRYSRVFGLSFALVAMVCLSICFLIYTDYFKHRKLSLLFGISLGLGMLTKVSFLLFLAGPLGYVLFQIFLSGKREGYLKQRFLNFIISLISGSLVASLWYGVAFPAVIKRIKLFLWRTTCHLPLVDSKLAPLVDSKLAHRFLFELNKIFWYLWSLINEQITLLFFIVFLIAIFFYLLKGKKRLLLILWIVIPYLTLSLSIHKEGRFMMSSLPAVALISAWGIQSIVSKRRRLSLSIIIVVLGLAQFFDISYNPYRKGRTLPFQIPVFGTIHVLYSPQSEHHEDLFYGPPSRKNWKIEEIANSIAKYYRKIPRFPLFVRVICCDSYTHNIYGYPFTLDYYLNKKEINCNTFNLLRGEGEMVKFSKMINKVNFIVFISQDSSSPNFGEIQAYLKGEFIKITKRGFRKALQDSRLIERIALPDGYFAYIYAKIYSIERGKLKLFFSGGLAQIYYNGVNLTKEPGINITFKANGKAYYSDEAIWSVKKEANKLIARGSWPDLPLTETWEVELTDKGNISWKVGIIADKAMEIKKGQADLLFNSRYRDWLSLSRKGKFPPLPKKNTWKVIEPSLDSKYIGLKASGKDNLSALLLDTRHSSILTQAVLQNTGQHQKARVLSIVMGDERLKLSKGSRPLFCGKLFIFDKNQQLYAYLKELKRKTTIQQGRLKLWVDNGKMRLYWKDEELTKGPGMNISFRLEGRLYNSNQAIWQIEKINERKLIARGSWPDLPLTETWEVELTDKGNISWKVGIIADKELKLKRWRASLRLSGKYQQWISLDESKKFKDSKVWNGVVLKDLANRCIGVKNYKEKNNIPGIIFEADTDATQCIPVINYNREVRDLRFHVAMKKDVIFLPGKHQLFSAKIMLLDKEEIDRYIKEAKQREQSRKEESRPSLTIKRGEIELFFDYGQGRIYYQGKELTKRFGLYTSLFSGGFWQDSQNAIWEIKKVNNHKIIAHGEWIYLPIAQDWEIELISEDTIKWKIKMQVYEEVNIQREQANIMLSPEYDNWVAIDSKKKGKFPDKFNKSGQEWKVLYSGSAKATRISANSLRKAGKSLPSVLFDCSSMSNYLIFAKNTNEIFKSHVLCCEKINRDKNTKFFPGEYEYFSGKIKLNIYPVGNRLSVAAVK